MRWLIVEDALRDRSGHWFEYISTFKQGLTELGDEVTILADQDTQPFIQESLDAQPVLPHSIWHRMGDGAGTLTRYLRVPLHALQTVWSMRRYLSQSHDFDVIFVPTVLVHHLLAWVWLLKRQLKQHSTRVILFFPNAPVNYEPSTKTYAWRASPTTTLLRFLLRSLTTEVHSGKVLLGAETHAMQQALTTLSGLPFTYFPHPVAPIPIERERSPKQKLVMGSYGGARSEKGSDILFQGIAAFSNYHPNAPVQFTLQCLQGFDEERQLLSGNAAVQWITRYFMEGEYAQHLSQTDVMLLPYRPSSYSLRVSRVVIEALVNGIPVIVTRGTTLAEQAMEWGASVLCEPDDPEALADAIAQVVEHYAELEQRANNAMERSQKHFSVVHFRECFLTKIQAESSLTPQKNPAQVPVDTKS